MSDERLLKDTIDSLLRLLADEKARLLSGRYEGLSALAGEKDALAKRLETLLINPRISGPTTAFRRRLVEIDRLARENETLLAAAKAGVTAAKSRLKDIVARQRNVGVYGETGEKLMAHDALSSRRKLA